MLSSRTSSQQYESLIVVRMRAARNFLRSSACELATVERAIAQSSWILRYSSVTDFMGQWTCPKHLPSLNRLFTPEVAGSRWELACELVLHALRGLTTMGNWIVLQSCARQSGKFIVHCLIVENNPICTPMQATRNNLKGSKFTASASEVLQLTPLLLTYMEQHALHLEAGRSSEAHVRSLIAVLTTLDHGPPTYQNVFDRNLSVWSICAHKVFER